MNLINLVTSHTHAQKKNSINQSMIIQILFSQSVLCPLIDMRAPGKHAGWLQTVSVVQNVNFTVLFKGCGTLMSNQYIAPCV